MSSCRPIPSDTGQRDLPHQLSIYPVEKIVSDMPIEFKLPEVSDGVETAEVAEICVAVGDLIEAGQTVMEVETEKAVAEIDCPHQGRLIEIHVAVGDVIPVGAVLLTIEESVETPTAAPSLPSTKQPSASASQVVENEAKLDPPPTSTVTAPPSKVSPVVTAVGSSHRDNDPPAPAGPSTRKMARQLGVDLHQVVGSGPGGRITRDDIKAHVRHLMTREAPDATAIMAAPPLPDFSLFGPVERQRMSKLARTSAAHLSLAWRNIPHVTQHILVDVTDLEVARRNYMKTFGQNGPKVTMTAIAIKAIVGVLQQFPHFNASLDPSTDEIVLKRYYHIGVAVDTEFGLVVPVIRDADQKNILELAAELDEVAQKARHRKLDMADMQGGTFTITNLGGIGGTAFTPIVNYPEVAILGMSRSHRQLQLVDGVPVERLMLPLSLSYDHRVVNGADAARFVVRLSQYFQSIFHLLLAR